MDNLKEEKKIEKRKEAIKKWMSDPYLVALILILVLAFALRLYFYTQTSSQPLWWDEAEYGSSGKYLVGLIDQYPLNPQRPFLFLEAVGLMFLVGVSEGLIKLLLVLIPSTILVYAVYLLGKEMFDKKIGLIAALLSAVCWTFVFWTTRLQPDFISMIFQLLSIILMWKYWKGQGGTKFVIWSSIFASLGFQFKVSGMIIPGLFFAFILLKEGFSFIKKKDYWIFLAGFFIALAPQFIYSYFAFGHATAIFGSGYADVVLLHKPMGWYNLNFFYSLTENLTFILFILGAILFLNFVLYLDVLFKDKKKFFSPEIFSIMSLVLISCFYIFYVRDTEDRWVFLWMPFIFFAVARSTLLIFDWIKKYNRTMGIIMVALLLGICCYSHIKHSDDLIQNKIAGYLPVKEAGLWIKDNSVQGDKVLSISFPQTAYYSERNVSSYSKINDSKDFINYLQSNRPKFVQISIFEPHRPWIFQQAQQNGYYGLLLPYFNSSVVLKDNKVISVDLKPEMREGNITFKYVYPTSQVNGVFVYEIVYD